MPDFPRPGILFYDITTVLQDADAFREVIDVLSARFADSGIEVVAATGGTVAASLDMVQELGGVPVAVAVLVELDSLEGRKRLERYNVDVTSFIHY